MNVMNLRGKIPWYSAGLHFECLRCGRCCAGPEQGYILVSSSEIRFIAAHLKIPIKEVKQKFLRRVGFRMTIVEDPRTRDCTFLRQTGQGGGCAIYDVRPAQCRNWPFWPVNLENADAWNSAARKCPGVNRGRLYTSEEILDKTRNKKWPVILPVRRSASENGSPSGRKDRDGKNDQIIARVSEIYNWLDRQLADKDAAGQCVACGKCCDFGQYDHRLYVTSPEIFYFVDKIGAANMKQMTSARCPYQVGGRCSVHACRFSGCRIFCCRGNAAFQSELTEAAIKKFKALCAELQMPYRYIELHMALEEFLTGGNVG